MIVDVAACEDCNNCCLACKDEHVDNEWPGYSRPQPRHGQRWIDVQRTERGQFPLIDVAYRPVMCMQCADAPCVKASEGAIKRRPDGIVLIDPVKAKGKQGLVKSCPYHQIWWNEAEQIPQKCTLCAHLLDQGWKQPRCAQACPTGALRIEHLDDDEMKLRVETDHLECLHPEYKTVPHVYYRNMYRYTSCFIAGSVSVTRDGNTDCAVGVGVRLLTGEKPIASAVTDAFGDFKFDRLASGNNYAVEIAMPGGNCKTLSIANLKESKNIGIVEI